MPKSVKYNFFINCKSSLDLVYKYDRAGSNKQTDRLKEREPKD